ncbi:hypothetical protein [Hydromonas duriensis]|uniref:hypothetical protein n=1 Tax=Hydromonas duriensis TaxID=1527608 RepID=UPI00105D3B28|nr:hypothetical protein [Hydromonas duriensis]
MATLPPKPYLDVALRQPCAPLPQLRINSNQDLKAAVLRNRIDSEAVHEECASRLLAVLQAMGMIENKVDK